MRIRTSAFALIGILAAIAPAALFGLRAAAPQATKLETRPGPSAGGSAYLPIGWQVTPAGTQKPAGFFPINVVLSPDDQAALLPGIVLDEHNKQTLYVLDAATGNVIQTVELDPRDKTRRDVVGPGLIFSHDGTKVYLATANRNSVLMFDWAKTAHKLTWRKTLNLPDGAYPQTVAISHDDRVLYVVGQYSRTLYAVDVNSGATTSIPVGAYPFGVTLSSDGTTAYVSNQAGNTVSVVAVRGQHLTALGQIRVGTHPNYLLADPHGGRIYTSNGDSDSISVIDTNSNTVTSTISLAPYKDAHAGTSPTGLALAADAKTLYVANSGNNDIAVVDVSETWNFGHIRGLIPTGWYPTGVQVPKDGSRLLIANAKGLGTGSNLGSDPADPRDFTYIVRQLRGYLQIVPMPDAGALRNFTNRVHDNNDVALGSAVRKPAGPVPETIIPRRTGVGSPIKHIIYIVKENRTYDQVLGDLGKGNGDPQLAIFGQHVTPNQHALADRFVTLDNYYADGEVSQDGWDWVTQANSNPYNELATQQGYGGNGAEWNTAGSVDSPVTAANADPARAFLWDAAQAAGLSFRHYGMFSQPASSFGPGDIVKCPPGKNCAYEPILDENTDHDYPWFDLTIPDEQRYQEWRREFDQYVERDNLPTFEFVDLPRDHTVGSFAGGNSAKAMVADNDLALGEIVDAVSHSKYWTDTAIFVTEDDAQDGPDHVDSHRTLGLVISPYTQRGIVDSHFYSQVSMLRSMELLTGLGPLTQYDASAIPMLWSFGNTPNPLPYTAITPKQSLAETNPVGTKSVVTLAEIRGTPDQIDEHALNQEIWTSVRGPNALVPSPQHHIYPADEYTGDDGP